MGSRSQPQQTTGTETQQILSSPAIEAALPLYLPQLMGMLSGTIDTSTFAPKVAPQTALQEQAIKSALAGQGFDYDPGSGAVTGTGIGAYQPFLDAAGTAAGQIQGAGAGALGQAQAALDQQQALAQGLSASAAASPFMQKASGAADAAQLAALAGQGAGTADFEAARALTGPGAYEQFMSPYQQEVIDTTRQELERQLQAQQAQLGAGAGSAFGGGRFGVAQGELAAQGATGIAQTLAGLRQQGFQQAQAANVQLPPEEEELQIEALVAQFVAEGMQNVKQLSAQISGQGPDPLVQLKEQELQIRAQAEQSDAQLEQAKLNLQAANQRQRADQFQQRLASQERQTQSRIDAAMQREFIKQRGDS